MRESFYNSECPSAPCNAVAGIIFNTQVAEEYPAITFLAHPTYAGIIFNTREVEERSGAWGTIGEN